LDVFLSGVGYRGSYTEQEQDFRGIKTSK
jgi:hypothetical protein